MKLLVSIFLILIIPNFCYSQSKVVEVYTYHEIPPYIISFKNRYGLYFDFLKLLNENQDQFSFKLVHLPRKRLDLFLKTQVFEGIVIGVSPLWFHDVEEDKYLWSPSIVRDQEEFVSHKDNPIQFDGDLKALQGRSFIGILGHYYKGIDELVGEDRIKRSDSESPLENLFRVSKRRFDFTILSKSNLNYLRKQSESLDNLFISRKPHTIYSRRIFFTPNQLDKKKVIDTIILQPRASSKWKKLLKQYGLTMN